MCAVESVGDAFDGGGTGGRACVSGVEVVEFDAEGFASVEVIEEGGEGLGGFGGVFLGKVYKVRTVREDVSVFIRKSGG